MACCELYGSDKSYIWKTKLFTLDTLNRKFCYFSIESNCKFPLGERDAEWWIAYWVRCYPDLVQTPFFCSCWLWWGSWSWLSPLRIILPLNFFTSLFYYCLENAYAFERKQFGNAHIVCVNAVQSWNRVDIRFRSHPHWYYVPAYGFSCNNQCI